MTAAEVTHAREWLHAHRAEITRIRPRINGSIVRYIPRRGWGTGLDGAIDGTPAMWSPIDGPDPIDWVFRELGIPVDAPLGGAR